MSTRASRYAEILGYDALEGFLQVVSAVKTVQELRTVVSQHMADKGFEFFTYVLVYPPTGPRKALFFTDFKQEWTQRYLEQKYVRHDLIVRHATRSLTPFMWNKIIEKRFYTPVQETMFNEGAEFGLKAGGTIPIHGPGAAKAYFTVSSDMSEEEFAKLFLKERHHLHIAATYIHERMLEIGFDEKEHRPTLQLSPREAEVLTWTADGKTITDISDILNLSETTVKQCLGRASHKLDTLNKAHSVAVAILQGLITL